MYIPTDKELNKKGEVKMKCPQCKKETPRLWGLDRTEPVCPACYRASNKMNMVMGKFGAKIQLLRITAGLSQSELAIKLHTGSPVVSSWETGKCLPRPRYLLQLARILGCEASELATLWVADNMAGVGKKVKANKKEVSENKNE